MATIRGSIDIARPVAEVFRTVADQRNEPRYNPRMLRSVKLTPGPIGPGTQFAATMAAGRRAVDMTIEVTEYDPPVRLGSRTTMSAATVQGALTFRAVPGGTRMSWSWQLRPTGFTRLATPVIGWLGRRQENAIWAGLKAYLEATPPAGSDS